MGRAKKKISVSIVCVNEKEKGWRVRENMKVGMG